MKRAVILLAITIAVLILMVTTISKAQQANPLQTLTNAFNDLNARVAGLQVRSDSLQTQINNLNILLTQPAAKDKAFEAFLFIPNIPGESTDDKHKDWIEVISYSHGLSTPVEFGGPGGRVTGRVNINDFSIVKRLDKSSPKLYEHLAEGRHIPEVKIVLTKATGDKQKYMEYILEDVLVSSVQTSGSTTGDEERPLEDISFNFGRIKWTYTQLDETGKPRGNVEACWDIERNTKC